MKTYFFMGWNRESDQAPAVIQIEPIPLTATAVVQQHLDMERRLREDIRKVFAV